LQALDRRVASSAGELAQAEVAVETVNAQIRTLQAEQMQVERDLLARRDQLRLLLRSAYAAGQWAPLKLWLDQDRFADATRALGYHQYLKQRQLLQLAELRELAARKLALSTALEEQRGAALAAVELRADKQLALERERAERAAHLAAAQARLQSSQSSLQALSADEAALKRLIEQVSNLIADIPKVLPQDQPLARRRGQLPWPVEGSVKARYGSAGGDGRPLRGLRIAAREGAPVKSVGHGRVAFADWLRGHGLLIIVDHGEGFMSLYAHCETLIKTEGDWVDTGEQLATVGRSGGASEAALHFELRKGKEAFDPLPWLSRRR
jgi:septal ring factor EnvC (AmiA/AmiB activator)